MFPFPSNARELLQKPFFYAYKDLINNMGIDKEFKSTTHQELRSTTVYPNDAVLMIACSVNGLV